MRDPLPPHPATEADEARRLMIDAALNHSGLVVGALVAVALVPFMLERLGVERYGLWLAAMVLAATLRGIDFGLGAVVTREVAAAGDAAARVAVAPLVNAAGAALLGLALVAGLAMVALAALAPQRLGLAPELAPLAVPVFALVAAASFAEAAIGFLGAALAGQRRFGALNVVAVSLALARAAAVVVALQLGASLVQLAWAHAAASFAVVALAAAAAYRGADGLALSPRLADGAALRAHLPFGLAMFAGSLGAVVMWQALPLLAAALLGGGALVAVHLGQRLPLVLTSLQARISAVAFPAASGGAAAPHVALVTGTRLVLHLSLPATVVGLLAAEPLLAAWLGRSDPTVGWVFRLTLLAVLADACGAVAATVLWARGAARPVLLMALAGALAMLAGSAWLLPRAGVVAGAALLALVHALASPWFWRAACAELGLAPDTAARRASAGLLLPTLGCALVAGAALELGWGPPSAALAAALLLGPIAYLALLLWRGASDDERALLRAATRRTTRRAGNAP